MVSKVKDNVVIMCLYSTWAFENGHSYFSTFLNNIYWTTFLTNTCSINTSLSVQALMFTLLSLSPFFSFFFPFLWFIRPSSLVLSFVTVFNCIAFLSMLFSLTEWTVFLFMHYPSMFLGILSGRCSSVWLVNISFPVRHCYCLTYKVLLFLRDGQYRIMH